MAHSQELLTRSSALRESYNIVAEYNRPLMATFAVQLRETATGRTRIVNYSADSDTEAQAFWWTDGNGGCDCNRELYFYDFPDRDTACGESRFEVIDLALVVPPAPGTADT